MSGAGPAAGAGASGETVLSVRDLAKTFPAARTGRRRRSAPPVQAVSGVSFDLAGGETLGLVGESGCGKSTTGRCVLRLVEPTAGSVHFRGRDVLAMGPGELRRLRRHLQIVFQDPYSSLDPRMTVASIVSEPLRVHGVGRREASARTAELLEMVGLHPGDGSRWPHEFSGGQRQRIGVARALALSPEVVVLDEPVSALDVSIRAGIVNLLEDLQDRLHLAYLFIAHDLSVVRHVCDRVAVMYLGRLVEVGSRDDVYARPAHPYTQALLSSVPVPDPARERARRPLVLHGEVPSPTDPPSGCRFRTRCHLFATGLDQEARRRCTDEQPALVDRGQGHPVACHFAVAGAVL